MAECCRCPYKIETDRKYGKTYSCSLERTNMDVTYFCRDKHKNEDNGSCPFVNPATRYSGVDYTKYETKFLTVK